MRIHLFILIGLVFSLSCREQSKLELSGSKLQQIAKHKPQVTKVSVINNQLVIEGDNLDKVLKIQMNGQDSFQEEFLPEQTSKNKIIANGLRNIAFAVDKAFSLVLSNAQGAAVFDVSFTLQNDAVTTTSIKNNSITADKLADMGANDGDGLVYNSALGEWETKSLNGLNMVGTWDANANSPLLLDGGAQTNPSAGDYYIVSVSGTSSVDSINAWTSGDWIIFNGTSWDKISNSSAVASFNGRQGSVMPQANDYTWNDIDKSVSSINDIADVDASTANTGQLLTYDGTKWIAQDPPAGAGGGGSGDITEVSAGVGLLGGATTGAANLSVDVGTGADQIVQLDATGKLPAVDGSQLLNMSQNIRNTIIEGYSSAGNVQITNTDSIEQAFGKTQGQIDATLTEVFSNQGKIGDNLAAINQINTDIANKVDNTTTVNGYALSSNVTLAKSDIGLTNVDDVQQLPMSYLDTDIALAASSDLKVPSQNAIKTYVDGQVSGLGANKVDKTTTVNGYALSSNVTLAKSDVGLANVDNVQQLPMSYLDTDTALTASSDVKVPSQNAIKAYVDGQVTNINTNKVDKTTTVNGYALSSNVTLAKSDVGLANVDNVQQLPLSYLDTDAALTANSDTKVASQAAVKSFVNAGLAGINQSQWTTAGSNIHFGTGSVAIGSTSPTAGTKLAVNGQVSTTVGTISTGAVDFSAGNLVTTSFDCSSPISFANMRNGASYTLIVTDPGTTTCSFNTSVTGDDAGTVTYYYQTPNDVRDPSTHTIYSFLRAGNNVYVAWVTGFQ